MPKVVNLGRARSLLNELEKVRQHILAGRITGFQASLLDSSGEETLYIGGTYSEDSRKATRALLRMSAVRTIAEGDPPLFQASRM